MTAGQIDRVRQGERGAGRKRLDTDRGDGLQGGVEVEDLAFRPAGECAGQVFPRREADLVPEPQQRRRSAGDPPARNAAAVSVLTYCSPRRSSIPSATMASALIRVARAVSPVRAARPCRSVGPSPNASNKPSSLAAKRCLAAMNPDASCMIGSGLGRSWSVSAEVWAVIVMKPASSLSVLRHILNPGEFTQISGVGSPNLLRYTPDMAQSLLPRVRDQISRAAADQLDWVGYSARMSEALRTVIPHERCCWHTVDPGTILFTGSVNRNVGCSGSWLAHYEYEVEDVGKWAFLAHSGRLAGALSLDTHGDLSRSARHRSHEAYGIGDELRVSLVSDGVYWGAAAFLRDAGARGTPPSTSAH